MKYPCADPLAGSFFAALHFPPPQYHHACDKDDQTDRQPQRGQHPHPWPGDQASQSQGDEHQRQAFKEVQTVDRNVIVLHNDLRIYHMTFLPRRRKVRNARCGKGMMRGIHSGLGTGKVQYQIKRVISFLNDIEEI